MGHVGKLIFALNSRQLFIDTFTGTAVTNNLLRKGFTVTAVMDIKPELCKGFPESIKVGRLTLKDLSYLFLDRLHPHQEKWQKSRMLLSQVIKLLK